jgi:hypothetical protein
MVYFIKKLNKKPIMDKNLNSQKNINKNIDQFLNNKYK